MPTRKSYPSANTEADNVRYKAKNQDEPGLQEKIEDLTSFIQKSKFGMMTTTAGGSGTLASRCMAVAGSVSIT